MRGLGGGETSLLNLLAALVSRGIRPVFICPKGALFRDASTLEIDLYPMEYPDVHLRGGIIPSLSLSSVFRIARLFSKENVSIAHAESLLGLYYGSFAARLCNIPVVATYHGYWPLNSIYNKLFLRLFCQRIYPVSMAMEIEVMPVWGNKNGHVSTIPLGVSSAFLATLPTREEARRRLGLPLDRPLVLHVARFQAIKGHHHLLNSLSLLVNELGEKAPLVLFVGGVLFPPSKEVLDYKSHVQRLAAQTAIKPHIRFLGHRQDVPLLMRAADMVVSPSDFESFGMTIIEAMITGTPVVATNAGGPGEIIEHSVTGLLVSPGQPAALASAIRRIIEHPESSARMADAARREALNRYGPQKRCDTLLEEYANLL